MNTTEVTYTDLELFHRDGEQIGAITDMISDPHTLEPQLLVVKTGRLRGEHLIPIDAVDHEDGKLVTNCDKDAVTSAPKADHTAPAKDELAALYEHYGLPAPSTS